MKKSGKKVEAVPVETGSQEFEFIDEGEVARRLGVVIPTIRAWRKSGILSFIPITRSCLRFCWSEVAMDLLSLQKSNRKKGT